MLDAKLRPLIDPPLNKAGRQLARLGVTANMVTLTGFAIGLAGIACLALNWYLVALACLGLNRVADGLDGAVARHAGLSDFGGYLDIVCDFIVYSGFVFGFAAGQPDAAVAAAFLVFSFMGTGSSFLAYAIFAAKHGQSTAIRGRKSLYYIGGLTEGTETIAVLAAICVFPGAFEWLAYGFGAACWITTAARVLAARDAFGNTTAPNC